MEKLYELLDKEPILFLLWFFLPYIAVAILLGASLPFLRRELTRYWPIKLFLSGALMLFASYYVLEILYELHLWRENFPNTPFQHAFSPEWPSELLRGTWASFRNFIALYTIAFFAAASVRWTLNRRSKQVALEG